MPSNINPLIFYGMFALVMVLDLLAAYFKVLPGDTASTLFISVVSVLIGVHIPSPSSTPANSVNASSSLPGAVNSGSNG